jgi:hypothetical protein
MNKELAEKGSRVEEIMETKKGTEIKKETFLSISI